MTHTQKFDFTKALICLVVGFFLTYQANASANNSGKIKSQTHEQIIAKELPLVNRELQSLIATVGARVIGQSSLQKDIGFVLLDSGRVASFNSTSGYIYVTRGMLLMTRTESDLAAIISLEVADIEQKWRSDIKHWRRAADILKSAGYQPANLPNFLSVLLKHKRLVDTEPLMQSLLGKSYQRLTQRRPDSVLKKLSFYVSKLEGADSKPTQPQENPNYLMQLDGLAIGQSANIELRNSASQVIKENGFTVFLPESWRVFRHRDVAEVIPLKSNALRIKPNESVLVLRSPLEQANEVIVYGEEKPQGDTTAAERLNQYIDDISVKSKVSREGDIIGDTWRGYFIEGKLTIKFDNLRKIHPLAVLNSISMTYKHRTAVVRLKERYVIATSLVIPYNDYDEIDREMFMNIVSSISDPNDVAGHSGPKHTIKTHRVAAGQTLLSLANKNSLSGSIEAIRLLNGLLTNDTLKVGQQIKLIENRN